MASQPKYMVAGGGRWGTRMGAMLESEGRFGGYCPSVRRLSAESIEAYEARMAEVFAATAAQVVWLCVPPGAHVPPLIRAIISAGLHVMVEKPWTYSREETSSLSAIASAANVSTAVHFEYCLLKQVEDWRREFRERADLRFGGVFEVSVADRLGIPAVWNLGSHLLAIQEYAAPRSEISAIRCGYEVKDQRRVWLEGGNGNAEIDFLGSKEPIIQRYLQRFEESLDGAAFPFDFAFAANVKEKVEAQGGLESASK
ncbi:MAG TPA: Gfo/Idh/MocA family oxidoreductase [Candidatus Acidoferrum sp.]|jgi:hypothetical protein